MRLEISNTRLKTGILKLRYKIKDLTLKLKEKDQKISELEAKLTDKEAQRKELLSYLYKPGKKNQESKPRGKKPGAPAFHRQAPKEEDVTWRCTYSLNKFDIYQKYPKVYWFNFLVND